MELPPRPPSLPPPPQHVSPNHTQSHRNHHPSDYPTYVKRVGLQRSLERLNGVLLLDDLGEGIPEGGGNIPEDSLAISLHLRIPVPGNAREKSRCWPKKLRKDVSMNINTGVFSWTDRDNFVADEFLNRKSVSSLITSRTFFFFFLHFVTVLAAAFCATCRHLSEVRMTASILKSDKWISSPSQSWLFFTI